jgi:hypothetical protein
MGRYLKIGMTLVVSGLARTLNVYFASAAYLWHPYIQEGMVFGSLRRPGLALLERLCGRILLEHV